ncbi:MAG: DMT family transporter [Alphaproteobacteria bacterium]|jgi:drug/metabolite transporter (DMT)-like permease|nr:DMT family transporter [Alphaproteobacteria bacterium]
MPRTDGKAVAYALLALTALFWSGNVVVGRAVAGEIPPFALTFWRWLLALAILLPFAWPGLRGKGPLIRRHWKILGLFGLLGVIGFNAFGYIAFHGTSALNAALINTLLPIMVVALSWALWRETLSRQQTLGIAISLLGTSAILARGDIAVLGALDVTRGDLWMLAAAASYALYTALLRLRPPELDEPAFLVVIGAFGAVALLPLVIGETIAVGAMPLTQRSLAAVAYVAVFSSLLGYIFWNRGIAMVGADRGAVFLHLMPVFTAGLGMMYLDEAPRPYHGLGMALILGGLLLVNRRVPGRAVPGAGPAAGGDSRAPGGRRD